VIDDFAVADFPERMAVPHLDGARQVQPFVIMERQSIKHSRPARQQEQQ
jgi:hypothetical protein